MQISNSSIFVGSVINDILVKEIDDLNIAKEKETKQNSSEANGYNRTSKLYFELSEDVSQYSTANPTQDRIDEDMVNILSKYEDGSYKDFFKFNSHLKVGFIAFSKEGKAHTNELVTNEKTEKISEMITTFGKEKKELINKYDYELYSQISNLISTRLDKNEFQEKIKELSKEYSSKVIKNAISDITRFNNLHATQSMEFKNSFTNFSSDDDWKKNITLIGEHFTHYNRADEEDMAKLNIKGKEGFQNTYRLSDEFAKTEKFDELYEEYNTKWSEITEEANEKGDFDPWNFIFGSDMMEVEKSLIIKKGYSKSEWIESIDKSKTLLEDMIKDNPDMMTKVKIDMEDNIKFYENILTDLKELWQYGDFKADG